MDYGSINRFLTEQGISLSFEKLILALRSPSFFASELGRCLKDGIMPQRQEFLTLAVLCFLFGIISQMVLAFGKKEDKGFLDTAFFLSTSGICLTLFLKCFCMVGQCIRTIVFFMKVLVPVFCISLTMAKGVSMASVLYAAVMGELFIFQLILSGVCLPGTKLLMSIHFANAVSGQQLFARFSRLLSDGVGLLLKGMLLVLSGFNVVESLISPGMDTILAEGAKAAAGCLPGLFTASSACLGVISGVAETIKNSIGGVGLFVLFLLFFPTFFTLLYYLAAFRLLEACVSPFTTESMNRLLTGVYESILLLFKVLLHTVAFLFVSLSVLTVFS